MAHPSVQSPDLAKRVEQFRAGDRRALSRLITWMDDGADPDPILARLPQTSSPARTVAITGSAGVGKSSLIAALVNHLRGRGLRTAVLMCDPSSPRTGGALLGDRVRIDQSPDDPDLYIRSMATRGGAGGISQATGPTVDLLKRFGFNAILIETIGTGQDQVAAAEVADTLLLVLTPGGGDSVQWQKAGILECAHLVAINKADLGGAEEVARAVHEVAGVPVQAVSAAKNEGIEALWHLIEGRSTRPGDDHPSAA